MMAAFSVQPFLQVEGEERRHSLRYRRRGNDLHVLLAVLRRLLRGQDDVLVVRQHDDLVSGAGVYRRQDLLVLGFIVLPPDTIAVAPRLRNTSSSPLPEATATVLDGAQVGLVAGLHLARELLRLSLDVVDLEAVSFPSEVP